MWGLSLVVGLVSDSDVNALPCCELSMCCINRFVNETPPRRGFDVATHGPDGDISSVCHGLVRFCCHDDHASILWISGVPKVRGY